MNKYTLEKNKTKILLVVSILFLMITSIIIYFIIKNKGEEDNSIKDEKVLAEQIATGTKNGEISLINTKSKKVTDKISLPKGEYVYSVNKDYDILYTYNGNSLYQIDMSDNKISKEKKIYDIKLKNVLGFKVDNKAVVFLSKDKKTITYFYQKDNGLKSKTINASSQVDDYYLQDNVLYYSSHSSLYEVSPQKEISIEIGDITDNIIGFNNKILIHNQFGKGLQNTIILSLNKKDLKIEDLKETESGSINILSIDSGDNVFYTAQYVSIEEPYYLLNKWVLKNGKFVKDNTTAIKIYLGKDAVVYNKSTTVASDGYLYTKYNDTMRIFDIHSQELFEIIPVDEYFAFPVLVK